jgi:PAS domain S-box-containing protein
MDSLLDTAPAGFLQFANDGTIIYINTTLMELLGYAAGEYAGRRIESILSIGARIFYQTHVFPLLRLHGRADEVYLALRTADGTEVPVLINAAKRAGSGADVYECVMIPIRQRSQYEDQILQAKKVAEEATRTKDDFLATVSHELRTPLNAIMGWVRMIRAGRLDSETVSRGLETIERNARSQARLIEDVLDFSRITSGKLRLDVQRIDAIDFVKAAVEVVRPAADAKGIKLQPILDPDAGPISGDPDRLQQVMWNLLSNAIKFTPKGGRVQVRLARINSHVDIVVSDTGKGITGDFLPYVFDQFRQQENSGQRNGGLGLGMSITRQIVELHGGTIRAESEGDGRGAAFTVELPVRNIESSDAAVREDGIGDPARSTHSQPAVPRLDGLNVLILDDDADALEMLRTILTQSGADVTAVGTVADALERLPVLKPDILVSDIDMRGQDGYSLIRSVRSLESRTLRVTPAIALTAQTRFSDRMRALLAGNQIHVPKPVEPDELVTIIANLNAGKILP